MLPEQLLGLFYCFAESVCTYVGCDDDGHSTFDEVFTVTEQCLQDR
jgi:hypothetical protein